MESSYKDCQDMYRDCGARVLHVSNLRISAASSMKNMFSHNPQLLAVVLGAPKGIPSDVSYMFAGCTKLEAVDINDIDAILIKSTEGMFLNCGSLRKIDISGWTTVLLEDSSDMFRGCNNLREVYMDSFFPLGVKDAQRMFADCPDGLEIRCTERFRDWAIENADELRLPVPLREKDCPQWKIVGEGYEVKENEHRAVQDTPETYSTKQEDFTVDLPPGYRFPSPPKQSEGQKAPKPSEPEEDKTLRYFIITMNDGNLDPNPTGFKAESPVRQSFELTVAMQKAAIDLETEDSIKTSHRPVYRYAYILEATKEEVDRLEKISSAGIRDFIDERKQMTSVLPVNAAAQRQKALLQNEWATTYGDGTTLPDLGCKLDYDSAGMEFVVTKMDTNEILLHRSLNPEYCLDDNILYLIPKIQDKLRMEGEDTHRGLGR